MENVPLGSYLFLTAFAIAPPFSAQFRCGHARLRSRGARRKSRAVSLLATENASGKLTRPEYSYRSERLQHAPHIRLRNRLAIRSRRIDPGVNPGAFPHQIGEAFDLVHSAVALSSASDPAPRRFLRRALRTSSSPSARISSLIVSRKAAVSSALKSNNFAAAFPASSPARSISPSLAA